LFLFTGIIGNVFGAIFRKHNLAVGASTFGMGLFGIYLGYLYYEKKYND